MDVDPTRLPAHLEGQTGDRVLEFCRSIVRETAHLAAAYKPNAAFFEGLGREGPDILQQVIGEAHRLAPQVPIIVDAKRADIASSNDGSVSFVYDFLGADAVTVHPYLGHEAVRPFLDRAEKGVFVLCRTSNPGAGEFQDLQVAGRPLFLHVAAAVEKDWNYNGNCGLVVGATYPEEMASVRRSVPHLPFLIPGIGAQGGDLEATVRASHIDGRLPAIINASRSIIYASDGEDYADAARTALEDLTSGVTSVIANLQ